MILPEELSSAVGGFPIGIGFDRVIAQTADRVAVMYLGRIVEEGPVRDVIRQPAHPYTRGLLECIPIPGKTEPGSRLGAIPGIVPLLM